MIAGALAWNVLLSGALSFLAACAFALLARRRVFDRRPRLAALLLALPFVKLAVELARGVPADAFFWEKTRGAVQEQGSFVIGAGVGRFGPIVRFAFGATYHGVSRPLSAADGLATIVDRRLGAGTSAALGVALASIGLALAAREIARLWRTARACRALAKAGTVVETRRAGARRVDVIVSAAWRGVPFAGGVLRPFVCVSGAVWAALSAGEREAVVRHELAHLRWFDGALLASARVARALLWFVPGAGAALRALATQCEIAADADAVRGGVAPAVLASALVRAGEVVTAARAPLLSLFRRERPAFVRRVRRLVDGEPPRALGVVPTALAVVIAVTVLRMTFFGNP